MIDRRWLLAALAVETAILTAGVAAGAWAIHRVGGIEVAASRFTGAGSRRAADNRGAILAALPPLSPGATVMLGDSLIQNGEWAELLGDPLVRNRGVSGDTTVRVRSRITEALRGAPPKRIYIMAGVNDLGGASPEVVGARYAALLDDLRQRAPGADVVVQSILPVNPEVGSVRQGLSHIAEANDRLRRLSASRGVAFLDLTPAMADADGRLRAAYTFDGLHLTAAGYAAWASALRHHHLQRTGSQVHSPSCRVGEDTCDGVARADVGAQ